MKRRQPPEPEGLPDRLRRYVFDEWNDLPDAPTDKFVIQHRHQTGTKGPVAEEWNLYRSVHAWLAFSRARRMNQTERNSQ